MPRDNVCYNYTGIFVLYQDTSTCPKTPIVTQTQCVEVSQMIQSRRLLYVSSTAQVEMFQSRPLT